MQVEDHLGQAAGDRGEPIDVPRAGDRATDSEPRAWVHGEQVGVLDDADQPAILSYDRRVADPALEQLEQHLAAQPVGRDREHGRCHHPRHRLVGRLERIRFATGWWPGSCTPTASSRLRARSSSGRATATGIR